jgi:hypothetical protein
MYISCHDPAGYTGNWQFRVIPIVNAVLCSVGPWMSQILFDQPHSTQLRALRRAPWRSSIKELYQLCVQGKLDFRLCVHIKGGCYKKDYCFFSGHLSQGRKHFTDSFVHLVPSLQALPQWTWLNFFHKLHKVFQFVNICWVNKPTRKWQCWEHLNI